MCIRDRFTESLIHAGFGVKMGKQTAIAGVLREEGYIEGFEVTAQPGNRRELTIELKYFDGKPVIEQLRRMSRPGPVSYTHLDVYKRQGAGETI